MNALIFLVPELCKHCSCVLHGQCAVLLTNLDNAKRDLHAHGGFRKKSLHLL